VGANRTKKEISQSEEREKVTSVSIQPFLSEGTNAFVKRATTRHLDIIKKKIFRCLDHYFSISITKLHYFEQRIHIFVLSEIREREVRERREGQERDSKKR
jgi:hypothetical protein